MDDLGDVLDRIRVISDTITRTQLTLLSAAIAFFALLSVIPLAVVIVAVAAMVGGEAVINAITDTFDHMITDEAAEIIRTGLEADAGQSSATILGLLFTTWASLRVFRALDRAFNTIYGKPGTSTIVDTAINGIAVLFALLGVLVIVSLVLIGLNIVGIVIPVWAIPLVTIPLLAFVLFPMYSLFPPGSTQLVTALPGAITAAVGITIATGALQLYIDLIGPFAIYGVLAGVFIVMLWLYVIAIVILVGAVVNATDLGTYRQLHVDRAS